MKCRKYNIAMFGHKQIPSKEGGVEVVVNELCTRMAEKGHSITCYNRSKEKIIPLKNRIRIYNGIKIKDVFTINAKGLAAVSSSFVSTLLSAFGRYDIIHIHAEGNCAFLFVLKFMKKKSIVTIHGLDYKRSKWGGFASKYILFGEKMAVKFADEIIVLNSWTQNYFKEKYNRDCVFIPNGVIKHNAVAAREIYEKYSLEKDGYILFLGRLVPEKGLEYLIKAFKDVHTDKKLVIAGGSSDTDDFVNNLRSLAADDDRILFTGFASGNLLDELFSNAYVYVLPSDLEGMPLSLLEAMSYGNCCLTSDIPEITEVIEDKAVIFKKGDISDLIDKMQMLVDSEDTVKKYKNISSDYICNKYNWDDVTDKTISLYDSCFD